MENSDGELGIVPLGFEECSAVLHSMDQEFYAVKLWASKEYGSFSR